MNTDAEDPRTKVNIYSVPVFGSQDWATMISLDTHTIKEMNTALAEKRESTPKVTDKQNRSRARRMCCAKSKPTVDTDSSDSTNEHSTKSVGGKGSKSSS